MLVQTKPSLKGNVPWKTIGLLAIGGVAIASTTALVLQWKHASLGRHISGEVVDFLKLHGATVNDGQIFGGPVRVSMPVRAAVVNTIEAIIGDVNAKARSPPKQSRKTREDAEETDEEPIGGRHAEKPKKFPEPIGLSGKTGLPIGKQVPSDSDGGIGNYTPGPGDSAGDYTYKPPMPRGSPGKTAQLEDDD